MAKVGGTTASSSTAASSSIVDLGFAKLQGENFEYYMQTYSIIIGRNSKKSAVDVDLRSLGGGLNISRLHARLFYDFKQRSFALEVIGKNGCLVQGVFYLPGDHLVELRSQDLLQFGDLKFYFLLPTKSIFASAAERRNDPDPVIPFAMPTGKNQLLEIDGGERNGEEELVDDQIVVSKTETRSLQEVVRNYAVSTGLMDMAGPSVLSDSLDKVSDLCLLVELEEKDVIKSVTSLVCDLYRPGEWISITELHAKLVERYGSVWHPSRVRNYLTNDLQQGQCTGKLWCGLLALLRKHSEHFVIDTRPSEEGTTEFVSLVILIT